MKSLIFIILFMFSFGAQAGLHLEPLVYYGMGTSNLKSSSTEFDQQGYLLGTRMGWWRSSFSVGLEYLTGRMDFEDDDSSFEYYETPHYMGAYVGYTLKQRMGMNLAYFPKIRSNADHTKRSGDGFKVEVFYRLRTHVSARLGYLHRTLRYDEDNDNNLSNKLESKTILLGISFPWVL